MSIVKDKSINLPERGLKVIGAPINTLVDLTNDLIIDLAKQAEANDNYLKLDNSEGTFMPLVIEILTPDIICMGHYSVQNGDLMSDPEVRFFWHRELSKVFPLEITQHYAYHNPWQVVAERDPVESKLHIKTNPYNSLLEFIEMWVENIIIQQELK